MYANQWAGSFGRCTNSADYVRTGVPDCRDEAGKMGWKAREQPREVFWNYSISGQRKRKRQWLNIAVLPTFTICWEQGVPTTHSGSRVGSRPDFQASNGLNIASIGDRRWLQIQCTIWIGRIQSAHLAVEACSEMPCRTLGQTPWQHPLCNH